MPSSIPWLFLRLGPSSAVCLPALSVVDPGLRAIADGVGCLNSCRAQERGSCSWARHHRSGRRRCYQWRLYHHRVYCAATASGHVFGTGWHGLQYRECCRSVARRRFHREIDMALVFLDQLARWRSLLWGCALLLPDPQVHKGSRSHTEGKAFTDGRTRHGLDYCIACLLYACTAVGWSIAILEFRNHHRVAGGVDSSGCLLHH